MRTLTHSTEYYSDLEVSSIRVCKVSPSRARSPTNSPSHIGSKRFYRRTWQWLA